MPGIKRQLHNLAKRNIRRVFRIGQGFGVDILPRHFYSSVPDVRHLENTTYWRKPTSMYGVPGADVDEQLRFASDCCPPQMRQSVKEMGLHVYASQENGVPGYGEVEADFLYCFICRHKPAKIVQVGAGVSTAIILKAAADSGYKVDLTCVDPFPETYLRKIGSEGKIKLLAEPAQEVTLSVLTELGTNGMLFVDSTHTVKVGSEVNRIVLEALPRLSNGTFVHFHDIFFPYDYQRSILTEPFFNCESTLLHAFLSCNARYTLRASLSMLHYARPDQLKELILNYRPQANQEGVRPDNVEGHFPSAAYLQVIQ
ncbi:MAG TPA: class I SAM-dependent methyltransferase [Tepidisphaeraceae bacterium]|jgi:predicted O-methyltransferase YrrM